MARINTNVPGLLAQHHLARTNADLASVLERLATGRRINRAADDPAGLIAADRLTTERAGAQQAIENAQRASAMIATADAALAEIADLLTSGITAVGRVAGETGVGADERAAAQTELDRILDAIDTLAASTMFANRKLLDGDAAYTIEGVDAHTATRVVVDAVGLDARDFVPVEVELLTPAARAQLFIEGGGPPTGGVLAGDVTVEVSGSRGTQTYSFAAGVGLDTIADAIQSNADVTGVGAALETAGNPASGIRLTSDAFGRDGTISVRVLDGVANWPAVLDGPGGTAATSAVGVDVVVAVNGTAVTGRGLDVHAVTDGLRLRMNLTPDAALGIAPMSGFRVTGGGLHVEAGARIGFETQLGIGLPAIRTDDLGGGWMPGVVSGSWQTLGDARTGGTAEIDAVGTETPLRLLRRSLAEIAVLRGRVGSFERQQLTPTADALVTQVEALSTSASRILDADFAAETAALARAQVLSQSGIAALRASENSAQLILRLLG